ncbi:Hypothetical protein FKW44_016654 [Caligus rogercresseyi]|uniref:Uncharacterized protein n=1 Tax=Caligus rogercresseyi TaxID=217165 RepID=A0A7T8H2F8_CALRO|nr:Hypothetical protein FKW44_016654 [Caligus rogercresseyi]
MDNKKKYRSGFQKRKRHEELQEERKKLPKINSFFQRTGEGEADAVAATSRVSEDATKKRTMERAWVRRGVVRLELALLR